MFEIKVACPGRSWEETPVFLTGDESVFTYQCTKQDALIHAIATAVARIACDEVRWNYQGNSQGHYVDPPHCPICGFVFSDNLSSPATAALIQTTGKPQASPQPRLRRY